MFKFTFLNACDDDVVGLKKVGELTSSVGIANAVDVELEYGRSRWKPSPYLHILPFEKPSKAIEICHRK